MTDILEPYPRIRHMLSGPGPKDRRFRDNGRKWNSLFAMASMGMPLLILRTAGKYNLRSGGVMPIIHASSPPSQVAPHLVWLPQKPGDVCCRDGGHRARFVLQLFENLVMCLPSHWQSGSCRRSAPLRNCTLLILSQLPGIVTPNALPWIM